jgi:transmembrane sensor
VTFALSAGRADFAVTPGGPRRWSVDCGLATVTVVGTAFTLTRSPRALEVSVSHGRVWVDGPLVEGRHRVLTAGQSLAVREPEAPTAPTPIAAVTAPRRVVRPRTISPPEPEAWRVRAAQGDARGAWDALGPDGFSQASAGATPDALLALADVARRTRHHDLAAPLLARFVAEHPTHPEAAMAAFTLGRDALSVRRQPSEAARWFERALALRPPRTLDEDLRARLVEARHAAGDLAGACAAARGYEAAFPAGRYAAQVRQRCAAE